MNNRSEKQLLEEINNEIDRSPNDMDIKSIEKKIDDYLGSEAPKISKTDSAKMADKIFAQHQRAKKKSKTHYPNKASIIIAVALFLSLTVIASANHSFIADGIRWVKEKINICMSEVPLDNETKQQADILMSQYKLPQNIPSGYIPKNYYVYQRSDECVDLCLEYIDEGRYLNFIISKYSNSDLAGIETPINSTEFKEQLIVDDIRITVCCIDEIYTAYYTYENCTYQITCNMSYDEFVNILNSIKK